MSEKALVESIHVEMKQHFTQGEKYLLVTPGNYGESFLRDELDVNLDYAVKCSNYIGESLDMAVQENIEEVLLVGHGGKLIKLAARLLLLSLILDFILIIQQHATDLHIGFLQ